MKRNILFFGIFIVIVVLAWFLFSSIYRKTGLANSDLGNNFYRENRVIVYEGCNGKEIAEPSIDSATFTVLNEYFSKDKNYVYFQHDDPCSQLVTEYTYDSATFHVFSTIDRKQSGTADNLYAEDKNGLYYASTKIEGVDMPTFKWLGDGYFEDKNHLYETDYYSAVNPASNSVPYDITPIDSSYLKTSNNVYFNLQGATRDAFSLKALNLDPNTFVVIDTSNITLGNDLYIKDKNGVYYKNEKIVGADPDTFVLLPVDADGGADYARDDVNVYFDGEMIDGADLKSFQVLNSGNSGKCLEGYYAKDNDNAYWATTTIIGADPATFKSLGMEYAKDTNHIYDKGVLIAQSTTTFVLPVCNDDDY